MLDTENADQQTQRSLVENSPTFGFFSLECLKPLRTTIFPFHTFPNHSPDLTPSGGYLFTHINEHQGGKGFSDNAEVKGVVYEWS